MEEFKIANFRNKHVQVTFPEFRELGVEACTLLRHRLDSRLGLQTGVDPQELTNAIFKRGTVVTTIDMDNPTLDVGEIFAENRIETPDWIYINWYRYDQVDEMKLKDFLKYLPDLWYPPAEDIDIFNDTCSWIISLMHYGSVKLTFLQG